MTQMDWTQKSETVTPNPPSPQPFGVTTETHRLLRGWELFWLRSENQRCKMIQKEKKKEKFCTVLFFNKVVGFAAVLHLFVAAYVCGGRLPVSVCRVLLL